MKAYFSSACLSLFLCMAGCGQPATVESQIREAWNNHNAPARLGGSYEVVFDKLPKQAKLETVPWSDSYWPSNLGGISARWNAHEPKPFSYAVLSEGEVRKMTPAELARLSPAEKYDIFMGRFDFPTVNSEWRRTAPTLASWEGLCHGWAAAAILFQEPRPVRLRGPGAIEVPFGAADVKALLTYYQAQGPSSHFRALGQRCYPNLTADPSPSLEPQCKDINAGSFHIVLANYIGLRKTSFVADITRDEEVWNQPIFGYETKIVSYQEPSPGAAPGTKKEIVLETAMQYAIEIQPQWDAINGPSAMSTATRTYQYRIELNAKDEIIGGEWLQEDRPDFLWTQTKPEFRGYYGHIETIYKVSLKAPAISNPSRANSPTPTHTSPAAD